MTWHSRRVPSGLFAQLPVDYQSRSGSDGGWQRWQTWSQSRYRCVRLSKRINVADSFIVIHSFIQHPDHIHPIKSGACLQTLGGLVTKKNNTHKKGYKISWKIVEKHLERLLGALTIPQSLDNTEQVLAGGCAAQSGTLFTHRGWRTENPLKIMRLSEEAPLIFFFFLLRDFHVTVLAHWFVCSVTQRVPWRLGCSQRN